MANPAENIPEVENLPESPQRELRHESLEHLIDEIQRETWIPAIITKVNGQELIADLYELGLPTEESPKPITRQGVKIYSLAPTSVFGGVTNPFHIDGQVLVRMLDIGVGFVIPPTIPFGSGRNKVLSILTNGSPGVIGWDYVKFNAGVAPLD